LQIAIRNYESAAADGHIESMNALGNLFFNELREYE
jgi:TPR repeat protein